MSPMIEQLLIAWCGVFVVITLTYLLSQRIKNAGIIDVLWGFSFAFLTIFFAWTGDGHEIRRWILTAAACLWAGRLGVHLLARFIKQHPIEDQRYAILRKKWGDRSNLKMFGIFHLQGLMMMAFAVIFAVPTWNSSPPIHILEIIALVILAVAFVGESVADLQLTRFKQGAKPEEVCEVGLWHYSRHPNYFFEWLIWVGFFIFACASGAWWTIYCPLLMLFQLLYVFGVPANEKQSLQTKGAAYERYQLTTSRFFPLPRKKTNI